MIEWKEDFSVGVNELDEQHKSLFGHLNHLSQAIEQKDSLSLNYLVTVLEIYTLFHLTFEEHLLAKHGYPDFQAHEKEHDRFKEKVAKFKAQLSDDKDRLAVEIRDYLQDWIVNHILRVDKKYSSFLMEKLSQ